MAAKSSNSAGVSFSTLLFLTFLVLKLTNTIDWSWWWITAPLWGGLAVFVIFLAVLLVIKAIIG
jgi:hypothetical protein